MQLPVSSAGFLGNQGKRSGKLQRSVNSNTFINSQARERTIALDQLHAVAQSNGA